MALAVAVGLELHQVPHVPVGAWLAAGPALIVLVLAVLQGPRWCLFALVAADIFGLFRVGIALGPGNLRLVDLPYVGLVGWVLVMRAKDGPQPRARLGQPVVGVWLIALGVSLLPAAVHSRGAATTPIIDWLRFVQTISLVWLVPYALRRLRDLELLLGVIALAMTLEVGGATIKAIVDGGLDARFRLAGGNSANSTGLLAALLVLISFHSPVPRRRALRVTILVVGSAGLILAKSLGSITAVALALAIFGFYRPATGRSPRNVGLVVPMRVILVALVALVLAVSVKGENLPGSPSFNKSSTMGRAILATAGLELFADHPLTGVGWESAPSPAEARRVNERLKRLFGNDVNPLFYPEATMPGRIYEHNAYVGVLAETGLLGFGLLLGAALAVALGIRSVLRNARAQPAVYAAAHCALVLLVAILVWMNDNTLFGLQPETILIATLLGALAAVPMLVRSAASEPIQEAAVRSGTANGG